MKNLLLYLILSFTSILSAQNVYKVKLEGCDTERFALESQRATTTVEDDILLKFVTKHLSPEVRAQLRGILKLQILVYTNGSSCFLSYENETNASRADFNIPAMKTAIDAELTWSPPEKNIAALIEIRFSKKKAIIKRYGMHGALGWHELKKAQ